MWSQWRVLKISLVKFHVRAEKRYGLIDGLILHSVSAAFRVRCFSPQLPFPDLLRYLSLRRSRPTCRTTGVRNLGLSMGRSGGKR